MTGVTHNKELGESVADYAEHLFLSVGNLSVQGLMGIERRIMVKLLCVDCFGGGSAGIMTLRGIKSVEIEVGGELETFGRAERSSQLEVDFPEVEIEQDI